MRRSLALATCFALLAVPVAGATGSPPGGGGSAARSRSAAHSWALPQIRVVISHGLMARDVDSFRPDDPLTRGELTALAAGLTQQLPKPSTAPDVPVTIAQLDSKLVRVLGLRDAAAAFTRGAAAAGIAPPARFGTEVVARLLGLRTNHPAAHDDLELLPQDAATRAEAAYSAAQILQFRGWEIDGVREAADAFVLPPLTPWQRRVLTTAVRFIGFPYVWGGTSERSEAPFGVRAHGGFDCSGFVWRVYKLEPYAGGTALATTLRGRTTFAMSGEVPRTRRIPLARLAPADVLFFGSRGPRSTPAQVGHTGIYLGGGWFIHASGQGVFLSPLAGWYRQRFAWARRPLAEAGLTG